jgi:glycosyltransferase involved in cell wall biosynthesis
MKLLVSILIINYNNKRLLKRSINSCLNQTYKNFEILIFDDSSSDGSIEILKKINNKKVKVVFNNSKKTGIPALDAKNGYYNLINCSKGQIIFLLDSDDYFKKNKVFEVMSFFSKNRNIDLVQDLPILRYNNKKIKKKNLNNFLSFWPYLAPESCISFRRKFIKNFFEKNKRLENNYKHVWFGFRIGVFAYYICNSLQTINKNLTIYKAIGESKKYRFLSYNWFLRRLMSFNYLYKILGSNKIFRFHIDYILTKIFVNYLKIFK